VRLGVSGFGESITVDDQRAPRHVDRLRRSGAL
jgi:hypothetical protein